MLPINKVKEILLRYEVLESSLSQSDIDKNTFVKNSKEYASIGDIIDDVKLYIKIINDQKSSEKILEDKSAEKELREMAEQELNEIKNKIVDLENKIKIFMLPKDEADEKNAIIEIRAGTGGLEAHCLLEICLKCIKKLHQITNGRLRLSIFQIVMRVDLKKLFFLYLVKMFFLS